MLLRRDRCACTLSETWASSRAAAVSAWLGEIGGVVVVAPAPGVIRNDLEKERIIRMRRMMQTRAAERGRTRRKKETHAIKRAGHRRGRCALLPRTSKWTFRHAACGQNHESIQPRNRLGEPATTSSSTSSSTAIVQDERLAPRAWRIYPAALSWHIAAAILVVVVVVVGTIRRRARKKRRINVDDDDWAPRTSIIVNIWSLSIIITPAVTRTMGIGAGGGGRGFEDNDESTAFTF
jgi:hypothetical protein